MNWIKNVGKSLKYTIPAVALNLVPIIQDNKNENKDFIKDITMQTKQLLRSGNQNSNIFGKIKNNEYTKLGSDLIKNTVSDLKSGNLYNIEREKKANEQMQRDFFGDDIMDMMSDLDNFDFDSDDNSSSSETTSKELSNKSENRNYYNTQENTNTINHNTLNNITQVTSNKNENLIHDDLSKIGILSLGISKTQSRSLNNLGHILQSNLEFNLKNTQGFYEQSALFFTTTQVGLQSINSELSKITSLLESQSKFFGIDGEEKISEFTRDIFNTSGTLNLETYSKEIKKNIKNVFGGADNDSLIMMLKPLIANPIGEAIKSAFHKVIPTNFVKTLENFNKVLSGLPSTMILQLNKWRDTSDNTFLKYLGKIFGVEFNKLKEINLGGYIQKAIPFDGITKRAITHVIPSLLAKILSAVQATSGYDSEKDSNQLVYNYDKGVFNDKKTILDKLEKEKESMLYEFNEYKKIMMDGLKDSFGDITEENKELVDKYLANQEEQIKKLQAYIIETGTIYKPGAVTKDQAGVSQKTVDLYEDMFKNLSSGEKFNYNQKIINTADNMKSFFDRLQRDVPDNMEKHVALDTENLNKESRIINSTSSKKFNTDKILSNANDIDTEMQQKGIIQSEITFNTDKIANTKKIKAMRDYKNRQKELYPNKPAPSDEEAMRYVEGRENRFKNIRKSFVDYDENKEPENFKDKALKLYNKPFSFLGNAINKLSNKLAVLFFGGDEERDPNKKTFFQKFREKIFGPKDQDISEGEDKKIKGLIPTIKNSINEKILKPLKDKIFGVKDEETGEIIKLGLVGHIKQILNNFFDSFNKNIFQPIKERITGLFNDFKEKLFNPIKINLTNFFSDFKDRLSKLFKPLGETFKNLFKNVSSMSGSIFAGIFGSKDKDVEKIGLLERIYNKVDSAVITPFRNWMDNTLLPIILTKIDLFKDKLLGAKDIDTGVYSGGIISGIINKTNDLFSNVNVYLFGKKGQDGEMDIEGYFSPEVKEKIKKYTKGGAVGLLASVFLPFGALSGVALGLLHQTEMGQKFLYDEETGIVPKAKRKFLEITGKIDSYLFGEKDEEGKRITTGVFTNTLNTFRIFVDETKVKFNKFLYGDENADSLFKQRGLFGYLKDKWDIILDNSKRFLFGEIDPETNKRKGGIFGQFIQFTTDTIFTPLKNELKKDWGKIKHFFAEEFIKPIKNAMEPFIYEFKIQFQKLKGVFKSGIQLVGNTIDNLFESSFGKPLSKIMVEYVVDPIKNTLKTIKDMAGSILKQILMFPINIIKKSAQDLKERHRLLGAGYAALTPDQEKERFGGFFGMFKKFGDKFNQFNYRRKNKEDFNIVQDIEKKKNTTDVVKDGSVVKVDKQERLDELNKESMKKQNKRIDDKNRLLEEKEKNKKSNPNKEIKKDTKETEKVVNKKEPSPNEEIKKDTKDIVINTDNMNTNIEKVVNANENINDSINKGNSNLLEGLKNGLNNVPENLKNIWSKISNIKFDSIKKSKKGKETISLTEEEDSTDHLKNISSNTKAISKEVKGQLNGVGHNINIIADILTKIAGGLSGIKQGKNKGFKGFLGNLLSFITSPFQAIANVLKHTVTEIIKLPVSIFSKAVKGISSILGSVGKVFGGLVSVVSNVGSGLMSLASSLLKVTLNTVAYITKFIGTVISETVKGITDLASSVISGVIKITVETGKAIAHVGGLILQGIPKAISAITKFSGALMLAALDVAKFAANIIWSGAKLFGKILASPFKALGRFTKKRLSDADGKSKNTAYLTGGIIDLVKNISLFDSAKNINVILSDLTSTVMEKFKNLINGGSGQDNEDDNLVDSTNIVKKTRRVIKRTKNTIKKANEIKDTTKEKAKDVFSNVKDKFDETKENIKGKGFKQVAIEQKQKIKEKLDTLFKNKLTDSTAKTAEHTGALVKDNKGILKWLIIAGGALLTLGKKLKDTITNNVIGKGLEGVGKIVGNALRNSALIRAMGTLLGRRKNVYGPPKPSKFSKLKNKFRESKAGKKLSSVKSSIGKGLTTAKNSITDATKSFGRFVSTKVGSFKSAVKTGLTKIGRFAGPAAAVAASGALMFSDYNESKEAGETGLKVVGTTLLGKTGDTIGGMFKNAGKQALKYGLLGGAIGTAFPVIGNIFGAAAGAVIGAVAGLFGSDPGKAIDNMKTGLANLGASIKQAWNTSIEAIGNTWTEYVKPGLKAVMGLIFSPLQTIENALYKDPFEMTGAERFIAKIIRGIISGFQGFGNAVYNFADRLTGGLLTSVKEGFTYFFNENPIGKTIYGAFLFVKDGINALRGVVSNVWETAKTVVPEFLSGVWEVAKDLGNSFLKVLEDAKDTIKNLGTTITDYLGKKWDSITNWFGSKIDIISNWIGDVLNSALGFLEKIPIVGDLIVGIRNAINWAKKTGGKYTDNVKATIIKTKSTASSIKDAAVNNVTNYTQKFRDRVDEEKINRVANNAQKKAVDKQWDNLDLWNAQQDQADKEKKDEKKKQNDLKQKYGVTSDTAMASLVSGSDESSGFFGSLFNGLKNTLSFFFSPLGSGDSSGGSASGSALDKSLNVISKNEGAYESINRNDNGATSVGKLQWHANRARNLIKTISSSEPSFNQELIAAGGASLIPKLNQDWSNMIITQNEASALKKVLSNSKYNKYQDKLASEDVQGYIEEGKKQGLTDSSALAYYADLYNQGGTNANSVAKKAIAADGGSLASMHQAAQASSVYGEYKNRRQATYAALVSNSSNNISGVTQWPLSGYNTISSPFGSRTDPETGKPANHLGIDIPAPEGTPIFSASKGIARVNLLDTSIYGNNILVESGKYNYLYGHLSKISVGEGSSVDTSTKIGEVGNTGKSYGNHLHFGVKSLDRNRWVDPLSVVSNSSRTGTGDTSGSSYSDITSGASDISGVTSTSNSEEPPKTFADVKNKLAEINEQNKNIQLVDRNFNLQKVAPDYAMLANNIDYLTASLSDSEKNNYTPNHLQYAANRSSYQNLGADMKQAPTIGNNWRQLIDLSHGTDSQMGEGNYKTVSLGLTTADITNMSNLSRMNAGIIDNNYKEFKGKTKEWLLSELGRTQFAWEEYSLLGKTSEQGWAGVYGSKIREYGKLVGEDLTTGVPKNEWGYIYKPYYRRDYNRPAGANTSLEEYLTIKQRVLELNNQLNKPEILASSNSSISKNNTTDVMASVNPILSSTTGNNVSTVQSVSYEKTIQNATNTALATATSASNDNPGSSFEKMIELLESIANSNKAIASKDLKVEVIDKTGTTDNSTTTTNNSNETNTSLNNKNIFINSNNNNNTALGQTENSKVYSNGINKNISRIAKGA